VEPEEDAVSDELVLTEMSGGVATLTLNRPERRNGWSPELEAAYFGALDALDVDDDVRAVVLTGAGSTFCPGLDTQRLAKVSSTGLDLSGRPPVFRPRGFRKPLIAAINGACAGIGLVQALMCDVRFAARGARFSTAFARRGLAAEYAISWVLPRYVGVEHALDLLLTARTFDAEEAHRLGLVSRLCEPGDVLPAAQAYAAEIATHCAPTALAAIRHQVYTDLEGGLEDAMRRALLLMKVANSSPDLAEGVASFVERRAPRFGPIGDFDAERVTGSAVPAARLRGDDVISPGSPAGN
jgi:enoyl-CoA hydratase/carnithine racemase